MKHALPHDALELAFQDRAGQVTSEAVSTSDLPDLGPLPITVDPAPDFRVVRDVRTTDLYVKAPRDPQARIVAAGYRSYLGIKSVARDQQMWLVFWSKRVAAYTTNDFPVVHRSPLR